MSINGSGNYNCHGAELPCVLIVDDEVAIRSALKRYFTRRGWDVYEAENGDVARRLLEPNVGCSFDVVICDLLMPECSGFGFYRWLSCARPDLAARVVFTTGDPQSEDSAEFLATARRPILRKPFDLYELGDVVDQVWRAAEAA